MFYCADVQKQANGRRGATPTPLKYAACQEQLKPIKGRATVNAFKTDVSFDDDEFTPRTMYCACHAQMSTDDNHENDNDDQKWTTSKSYVFYQHDVGKLANCMRVATLTWPKSGPCHEK